MALFVGFTGCLTLLYGGFVSSAINSGMARIVPLEVVNFDMLVLLEGGQEVIPQSNLPRARYGRDLLSSYESCLLLNVASQYGDLPLLGIPENSTFFPAAFPQENNRQENLTGGRIIVPATFAARNGLQIGDPLDICYDTSRGQQRFTLQISGIISEDAYPVALTSYSWLQQESGESRSNAVLIWQNTTDADMSHLEEYMASVYPRATRICSLLPQQLGGTMLAQAFRPGNLLLIFIYLFMGIGVLTIALVTFLERRGELATLKSVGVSNKQMVYLFGMEYGLAELAGVTITWLVGFGLISKISIFAHIGNGEISGMILSGNLIALIVLLLSLVYPVGIARIATVNQLLYARTIPLQTLEFDHLLSPTGALALQEIEDNVRIVRVPWRGISDVYDCIVLKQVGDRVKQGEIIASEELMQGSIINNFASICDGTVIALRGPLIYIKPDTDDAPRYLYPAYLIQDELQRRAFMEQIRQNERELIEQGSDSTERKLNTGMQHNFRPQADDREIPEDPPEHGEQLPEHTDQEDPDPEDPGTLPHTPHQH